MNSTPPKSFFADDDRRRFVLALAVAIALHEIFAGLVPWRDRAALPQAREIITIAKLVRIEHRATPTPKPSPTPIVHLKTVAPVNPKPAILNPGRPAENRHIPRVASARPLIRTIRHSRPAATHVLMGGQGTGTSATAKAPTGGAGTGGNGAGQSGKGAGTGGAPGGQEPCGAVYFQPNSSPTIDAPTGRVWERITMTVHFPDGAQQSVDLDYPFYYPSRTVDPYFPENSSVPATFQFPPSAQRSSEPAVVQYVMQHTGADGYTTLRNC